MTRYRTEATGHKFFKVIDTTAAERPPVTTADPNSLGELMRKAIFLPGDPFPYDPKVIVKNRLSGQSPER